MNQKIKETIKEVLDTYRELPFLLPEDLPSLDLYMDQVTTLMEENLAPTRRTDQDKLLTKTMINNYAKNKLLPPPNKKRYAQEHILLLTMIYYFKSSLSMQDIKLILDAIRTDGPGNTHTGEEAAAPLPGIEQIYARVFSDEETILTAIEQNVQQYLDRAAERFEETENQEKEQLQLFSLICDLLMDIYVKKRLVEQLIDTNY